MSNPYIDYYQKQIGRGLPGFRGMKYQRGYGFLTSLISKAIVPLFRTVRSVDPGNIVKLAANVLKSPGLQPGKPIADDIARIGATATGALINSLQSGKGRRYKRIRSTKKVSFRRKKRRNTRRKAKRRVTKRRRNLKGKKRLRKQFCKKVRKCLKKRKKSIRKRRRSQKPKKIIDALS